MTTRWRIELECEHDTTNTKEPIRRQLARAFLDGQIGGSRGDGSKVAWRVVHIDPVRGDA